MASWEELINKAVDRRLGGLAFANISYAKLETLTPLMFRLESDTNVELKDEFLVVPKHRVFTSKDIGKKFVFIRNNGGQTYFYFYEPSSPQGSNGVPYRWKGEIEQCELIGHCPDGEVIVTHGIIDIAIHGEGIE